MIDDNGLQPGEYWVTQIDPETGRITQTVERSWLLAPFFGTWELVSDIARGRMKTRDWVFVMVIVMLMTRGGN